MVIAEHLHIMSKGTVAWNTWRRLHPTLQPDLSFATLSDQDLSKMDLSGVNLVGATLYEVNLSGQDLSNMDLGGANLCGADLSRAILVGTNLANTTLKDCTIYGVSVWDVRLNGAEQINLTITPKDQPTITVDNLKIAQFIYLLLDNKEIRDAIDTIAKKAVLILGHFGKRKPVLDVLRDELRSDSKVARYNYTFASGAHLAYHHCVPLESF